MKKEKIKHIVIVDDDKMFVDAIISFAFLDKKVDIYNHPDEFLNDISRYADNAEETLFCIDNNFKNSSTKGMDVAKKLHEMGLKKLYLLSAEDFECEKVKIPEYLVVISKIDLDSIEKLGVL